jgi:hypothetical protein
MRSMSRGRPSGGHRSPGQRGAGRPSAGYRSSGLPSASQHGASQYGASQYGASQYGASQHGASQHGASQHGASQHGASQHGASQHGASQPTAGRPSTSQHGTGRPSTSQHRTGQPSDNRRAARPRRRTIAAASSWIIALGVVAALVGAALIAGRQPQRAVFAASTHQAPMFGANYQSKAELAQETAEFGRMAIVHVYYSGLPSENAWTSGLAAANHSAVIVSFNASPKSVLSGADNAVLSHFFDTAPRGHAIYYSYIHEPERPIKLGRFTAAAYKEAWAKVAALAAAAHNPYLHSTLILMAYDLTRWAHRNWHSYLPGGGIISTLGWDAYPVGSALNIHPQLTPPSVFMGPEIAASKSVGLPFGFSEFGLSTPRGRPAWLRTVGNYLMRSGALFATLFNGSTKRTFLKLTDRASIAVWRSFVSRSGAAVPQPTPSSSPTASKRPRAAVRVTGLRLAPTALRPGGGRRALITFWLSRRSNVTVCLLNAKAAVVRMLSRPGQAAGRVTVPYYGHSNRGYLGAGTYTVLVVANATAGSATAESRLTISRR